MKCNSDEVVSEQAQNMESPENKKCPLQENQVIRSLKHIVKLYLQLKDETNKYQRPIHKNDSTYFW